jgi:hypothetical protein
MDEPLFVNLFTSAGKKEDAVLGRLQTPSYAKSDSGQATQ